MFRRTTPALLGWGPLVCLFRSPAAPLYWPHLSQWDTHSIYDTCSTDLPTEQPPFLRPQDIPRFCWNSLINDKICDRDKDYVITDPRYVRVRVTLGVTWRDVKWRDMTWRYMTWPDLTWRHLMSRNVSSRWSEWQEARVTKIVTTRHTDQSMAR